jgi:hypothetical protein
MERDRVIRSGELLTRLLITVALNQPIVANPYPFAGWWSGYRRDPHDPGLQNRSPTASILPSDAKLL